MEMKRIALLLTIAGLLSALILVTGCTSETDGTPAPGEAPDDTPVTLNETMNESTVVVKLNSRFYLELEENPSTGYSWNLTTTDGLRVISEDHIAPDTATPVVGAPTTRRWELEAVATGLQEVEGLYLRSWEGPGSAVDRFIAEISVEP